jgi:hypothetical protein
MCAKPAIPQGVDQYLDTGPYCTTYCTTDSDCDWPTRDMKDSNDKRCKRGFTCAIAFGAAENVPKGGDLCCRSVCLCRDFIPQGAKPAVPEECQNGSGSTCSSPPQRD